jgi:ADP-ribose pyrophosphatase YjhB (NUDIX family)
MHYIKSYILDKLSVQKVLRNKDMRPPRVESNLYQYHLKQLQLEQYVAKVDGGYTLANKGLAYAATHSATLKKERPQPQVLTVLFVTNQNGRILIRTKQRQPFIGMGGLVIGKMHRDETVFDAAKREFFEKVSEASDEITLDYFGSAHVVVRQQNCVISDYVGLLIRVAVPNGVSLKSEGSFYDIDQINKRFLSPGVNELLDAYVQKAQFVEIETEFTEKIN